MNRKPQVGDTFVYTQAMRDACTCSSGESAATAIGRTYTVSRFDYDGEACFDCGDGEFFIDSEQMRAAVFEPPVPVQLDLEEHCAAAGALKFDQAKVDLTLAPGEAVSAISQALEYGAGKYGRDNFREEPVLSPERLTAGVLRHMFQFARGEQLDAESGLPHTYHAAAGLAMLHATTCAEPIGERFEAEDENTTKS